MMSSENEIDQDNKKMIVETPACYFNESIRSVNSTTSASTTTSTATSDSVLESNAASSKDNHQETSSINDDMIIGDIISILPTNMQPISIQPSPPMDAHHDKFGWVNFPLVQGRRESYNKNFMS